MTRLQELAREFRATAKIYVKRPNLAGHVTNSATIIDLYECLARLAEEVDRIKREGRKLP